MKKVFLDAGDKGSRAARLVRFLLKMTTPGQVYYIERHIKKSKKRGLAAIGEGYKNFLKETLCQDAPGTADIYQAGESHGKREGYAAAAELFGKEIREIGKKLVQLKQKHKEFTQAQREEYEKVIKAYDDELERMTAKCDKTESENKYLRELIEERNALVIP